jgi:hypothetical protein
MMSDMGDEDRYEVERLDQRKADRLREQAGLRANLASQPTYTPFDREYEQAFPIEPEPGTVLGFTKRYTEDGPAYSFAAVRVAPRRVSWYLTGRETEPVDWVTLLDFIGGPDEWARVGVVAAWHPLGAENYHTDCIPVEQA